VRELPSPASLTARRSAETRLVFFLPYSFDIRPDTYDPDGFFQDIKLYLRFNTPLIPIDELCDRNNERSPLTRVLQMLDSPADTDFRSLDYELRLLGAVIKSNLRDLTSPDSTMRPQQNVSCRTAITRIDGLIRDLLPLREHLESTSGPIRERLALVDEHLSLTVEEYLCRLFAGEQDGTLKTELAERISAEQDYRRQHEYASVVSGGAPESETEQYVYRQKQLKRFATSVLFFEITRGNQSKRVEQLLYALAAGLAMAVATAISFIGQIRFGSISLALFTVLVVAYMIKDRLKDLMRSLFHRTLGRFFFDRRTVFRDPSTNRRLGVVKERLAFVREHQISPLVRETRNRAPFEQQLSQTSPESIVEYTKRLTVRERRLHRIHTRLAGIADINIIDLRGILRHLSDQTERVPVPSNDGITFVDQKRIYHLNVVIVVDGHAEKLRMIVDGNGIRRIEHSGGGT
jgi:hypothetical protein